MVGRNENCQMKINKKNTERQFANYGYIIMNKQKNEKIFTDNDCHIS